MPDELDLPPDQALDYAQRLLDEGRPFGAHEVLEAVWKTDLARQAGEEALWRALAQIAVGVTHLERGNPTGARRLLERGARGLTAYRGTSPHAIAVDRLADQSAELAARLADGTTPAAPILRLRD